MGAEDLAEEEGGWGRSRSVEVGEEEEGAAELATGWQQQWSQSKQAPYYRHLASGATTWTPPTRLTRVGQGKEAQADGGGRRGAGREREAAVSQVSGEVGVEADGRRRRSLVGLGLVLKEEPLAQEVHVEKVVC
jgi:hypothetical protein